jgi:hypothetical protein
LVRLSYLEAHARAVHRDVPLASLVVQTHQQFLLDDHAEELTEADSINYHQARQPKKTVLPPEDGDIDFLGDFGSRMRSGSPWSRLWPKIS